MLVSTFISQNKLFQVYMNQDATDFANNELTCTVVENDMDELVEMWHKSDTEKSVYEYLGISFEEYKKYVKNEQVISTTSINNSKKE